MGILEKMFRHTPASCDWARSLPPDTTPQQAWDLCPRPDWLLGVVGRVYASAPWSAGRKPLVRAVCEVVMLAEPAPEAELEAIQVLLSWSRGVTSRAAARAAYAVTDGDAICDAVYDVAISSTPAPAVARAVAAARACDVVQGLAAVWAAHIVALAAAFAVTDDTHAAALAAARAALHADAIAACAEALAAGDADAHIVARAAACTEALAAGDADAHIVARAAAYTEALAAGDVDAYIVARAAACTEAIADYAAALAVADAAGTEVPPTAYRAYADRTAFDPAACTVVRRHFPSPPEIDREPLTRRKIRRRIRA